eukprot:1283898-Amorphochlora_amoeboformis.AAC.1
MLAKSGGWTKVRVRAKVGLVLDWVGSGWKRSLSWGRDKYIDGQVCRRGESSRGTEVKYSSFLKVKRRSPGGKNK